MTSDNDYNAGPDENDMLQGMIDETNAEAAAYEAMVEAAELAERERSGRWSEDEAGGTDEFPW